MFKVNDRIVPKLDTWKPIIGMYACFNVNVPDDPPVLTINYISPKDGLVFYICSYKGFQISFEHKNVLKAP